MKKLTFTETSRAEGNIYCPYTITLNQEEYNKYNKKIEELEEKGIEENELAEELLYYIRKYYADRIEEGDQDLSEVYPGETEETTLDEEDLDK